MIYLKNLFISRLVAAIVFKIFSKRKIKIMPKKINIKKSN